jgi:hypothetical protein
MDYTLTITEKESITISLILIGWNEKQEKNQVKVLLSYNDGKSLMGQLIYNTSAFYPSPLYKPTGRKALCDMLGYLTDEGWIKELPIGVQSFLNQYNADLLNWLCDLQVENEA